MRRRSATAAAVLLLAFPAVAAGGGGDDETRVRVACVGGRAELRLRARDDDGGGTIAVELRIDAPRAQTWRLVVLHERKLVYQGIRRATRSVRYYRTVPNWPGLETVTFRATTADGRTCRLQAAI